MLIRLEDIPPKGLSIKFTANQITNKDLGLQVKKILTPPIFHIQLNLLGNTVEAYGEYKTNLKLICSRCLKLFSINIHNEVNLIFKPDNTLMKHNSFRFNNNNNNNTEIAFYKNNELDLTETLRDELILALPIAPVCNKKCSGIY